MQRNIHFTHINNSCTQSIQQAKVIFCQTMRFFSYKFLIFINKIFFVHPLYSVPVILIVLPMTQKCSFFLFTISLSNRSTLYDLTKQRKNFPSTFLHELNTFPNFRSFQNIFLHFPIAIICLLHRIISDLHSF